jgi:hypothetical protein
MQTLKKVLIGLGVLFCVALLAVGVLLVMQGNFKEEQEPFIRQFMADYSRRWDVADVYSQVTNEFLMQIQSSAGREAVAVFRRLGKIEEITDVSIQNFFAGTQGKTGTFSFKARFENAPTVVQIVVKESDSAVRVQAIHITPASDLPLMGRSETGI